MWDSAVFQLPIMRLSGLGKSLNQNIASEYSFVGVEFSLTMRAFLRNHKKLASVIGLIALLFAALLAWSLSAPTRGRLTARFDSKRGHYIFLTFGLEPPERREIARLLQERYGVKLRTVAGDIVSEDLVSYVRSYNEVMDAATNRKFGHDV
jgi:phosphoglycerate-specific signal transduction histidine kinase